MATGVDFVCDSCARTIEAWDEGNPYYFDGSGEKHYAYHPDPERGLCTGVDTPMLCLGCGADFMSDSAAPTRKCPKCAARRIARTSNLNGKKCPYCAIGAFRLDEHSLKIS